MVAPPIPHRATPNNGAPIFRWRARSDMASQTSFFSFLHIRAYPYHEYVAKEAPEKLAMTQSTAIIYLFILCFSLVLWPPPCHTSTLTVYMAYRLKRSVGDSLVDPTVETSCL